MALDPQLHRLLFPSFDEIGISQAEAREWCALYPASPRFDQVASAREWHRLGLSPADARPWVEADVVFDTALLAGACGVDYATFEKWSKHGVNDGPIIALLERNPDLPRADALLELGRFGCKAIGRMWPGIWELFERLHDNPMRFVKHISASMVANIIVPDSLVDEMDEIPIAGTSRGQRLAFAMKVLSLARWRCTQSVYRFTPELRKAVVASALPETLDLTYLPEPAVWIELDGEDGAVAALVTQVEDGPDPVFVLNRFYLDRGSLTTVVHTKEIRERQVDIGEEILGDMALAMYLTTTDADLDGVSREIRPTHTKRGPRLFPPNTMQVRTAGVRVAAALRRYQQQVDDASANGDGLKRTVAPHIRRGHFSRFRIGPRKNREPDRPIDYRIHWIPPIPVNVRDVDELDVMVRPVAKTPGYASSDG